MKQWDLYDKNLVNTGKKVSNRNEVPEGFYHLSIECWIINSKKELLLLRKAVDYSRLYPDTWSCVGGYLLSGEEAKDSVKREIKEKLGISINAENVIIKKPVKRDPYRYAYVTCIVQEDIDVKKIKLNGSYTEYKFVNKEELTKLCNNGEVSYYLVDRINKEVDKYLK
jgi:isopentenyldiphosphate isomerase